MRSLASGNLAHGDMPISVKVGGCERPLSFHLSGLVKPADEPPPRESPVKLGNLSPGIVQYDGSSANLDRLQSPS